MGCLFLIFGVLGAAAAFLILQRYFDRKMREDDEEMD